MRYLALALCALLLAGGIFAAGLPRHQRGVNFVPTEVWTLHLDLDENWACYDLEGTVGVNQTATAEDRTFNISFDNQDLTEPACIAPGANATSVVGMDCTSEAVIPAPAYRVTYSEIQIQSFCARGASVGSTVHATWTAEW